MKLSSLMGLNDHIQVWAQMFFEDGSVTEGKRFPSDLTDNPKYLKGIAYNFLKDTHREEGVLMIWGDGKMIIKKATLLLLKRGETLRFRNLGLFLPV